MGNNENLTNCFNCSEVLNGRKFVRLNNLNLCIPCYEKKFAHRCIKCEKLISADQKEVSFNHENSFSNSSINSFYWHEDCFSCSKCNQHLTSKQLVFKNKCLFCLKCYKKCPESKCSTCLLPFKEGEVTYEFEGNFWHEHCFTCFHCHKKLKSNLFVEKQFLKPHNNQKFSAICVQCYEQNYANTCFFCKKIISNGGVKVNDICWHKACFACNNCNKLLLDGDFHLLYREGENLENSFSPTLLCRNCFLEVNSVSCYKCSFPIVDNQEKGEPFNNLNRDEEDFSKCVCFGNNKWHSSCFHCSECGKSLVEQSFVMKDEKLFCLKCSKEVQIKS